MFIYPSAKATRPTLEDLHRQLVESGIAASIERDGDALWLTLGSEAELSLTLEGDRVTSAMLDGVPDDPAVLTQLEGVFDRLRWEIDADNGSGEY